MVERRKNDENTRYAYDALDNITTENVSDANYNSLYYASYSYDERNQLISKVKAVGDDLSQNNYFYDKMGNLVEMFNYGPTEGNYQRFYTYTPENQLATGETEKGRSAYTYNALGDRVQLIQSQTEMMDFNDSSNDMFSGEALENEDHLFFDPNADNLDQPSMETYGYGNNREIIKTYVVDPTSPIKNDLQVTTGEAYSIAQDITKYVYGATGKISQEHVDNFAYPYGKFYYHTDRLGSLDFLTDRYSTVEATVSMNIWGEIENTQNLEKFGISAQFTTYLGRIGEQ